MPDKPDGLPELLGVCPRNDAPEGTDVSLTPCTIAKNPAILTGEGEQRQDIVRARICTNCRSPNTALLG